MKFKNRIQQLIKLLQQERLLWPFAIITTCYIGIMLFSLRYSPMVAFLLLLLFVIIMLVGYDHLKRYTQYLSKRFSEVSPAIRMAQEDSLYQSPIAVLIYDDSRKVRWLNPALQHIFGTKHLLGEQLLDIGPEFEEILSWTNEQKWQPIQIGQQYYKVLHQNVYHAIYFLDITKEQRTLDLRQYEQIVFGYLFLDDYDELVQSFDDSQESKFDAELLNELTQWASQYGVYLKRLDTEKFILLANKKSLEQLEKDKFKQLERIKERNYAKNIPVAISVGLAYPEDEIYEIDDLAIQAQLNLDLALGRGGDQVVVRAQGAKARFYGGKISQTEKRTITRSKLVYQALLTSIEQADKIFIAGHRYPDLDAISSALGILKIVEQQNKFAKIIVNPAEFNYDVSQLLNYPTFKNELSNIFITIEEAEALSDAHTLIIMVDHHRPSLSAAGNLVQEHDVVIIDHHRRSEEFPPNSVLTFIEPYASSTAELVTEFYIYMRNTKETLTKLEATALLAGIIVDTNNFTARTGSRTFDAASYLKSRGANMVQIQQLLKEDFEHIRKRNDIIAKTQFIDKNIAIAVAKDTIQYDNVIASQAADRMLGLKDVEASFVIYNRLDDCIGISARSLGTINVQTIMEQMGGGGHLSNAATQIRDSQLNEVFHQLVQIIEKSKEEEK